jgi:hypothetical protein
MHSMNKRQKSLISEFILVCVIIIVAVMALLNFKDYVNRTEAMRAMTQLGQLALDYRRERGSVPPEYYVKEIKEQLEGRARLGRLVYRARWIEYGAKGDEILAYTRGGYGMILGSGYIVLRLDGRVEWMGEKEFKKLLDSQQSPDEKRFGEQKF